MATVPCSLLLLTLLLLSSALVAKAIVPPPPPPPACNPSSPYQRNATEFFAALNTSLTTFTHRVAQAQWAFHSDVTLTTMASANYAVEQMQTWLSAERALGMIFYPSASFLPPPAPSHPPPPPPSPPLCQSTERQAFLLSLSTVYPTDSKDRQALTYSISSMSSLFANTTCCVPVSFFSSPATVSPSASPSSSSRAPPAPPPPSMCIPLMGDESAPTLQSIMATSREPSQLLTVWEAWYNKVGAAQAPLFADYVHTGNVGAHAAGYADLGAFWRAQFVGGSWESIAASLYKQIEPLYTSLHCHVRHRLSALYGGSVVPSSGPLPAHVLGDMAGAQWQALMALVAPYPNTTSASNVTAGLHAANYSLAKMVDQADAFFASLGLPSFPASFNANSRSQHSGGSHAVLCDARAWDLGDGDYRVGMCGHVDEPSFGSVYSQVGQAHYLMAYSNQSALFRQEAGPGVMEAVGGVARLAAASPSYMQSIGLLSASWEPSPINLANYQMQLALEMIPQLPSAYVQDLWRWQAFSKGPTPTETLNGLWWQLLQQYAGLKAPSTRNANVLDPAAMLAVAMGMPTMSVFAGLILQFQIFKHLCILSGQGAIPLWNCSLANKPEAGRVLQDAMSLGASHSWYEVMSMLANTTTLDASSMLEYFAPLGAWLAQENSAAHPQCGWMQAPVSTTTAPGISTLSEKVEVGVAVALLGVAVILGAGLCYVQHKRRRQGQGGARKGDVLCIEWGTKSHKKSSMREDGRGTGRRTGSADTNDSDGSGSDDELLMALEER